MPIEEMKRRVRRNVRLAYAQEFFTTAMAGSAIMWPFFKENGLTVGQLFTIEALFVVFLLFMEIPSGYLADYLGRRPTMIIATVFGIGGYVTYALSSTFEWLLFGEFQLAVLISFRSGTVEAFIRDWHWQLEGSAQDKEHGYRPGFRTIQMLRYGGSALGAILAMCIAPLSLRAAWWATALTTFLALLFVLRMQEPPHERKPHETGILKLLLHSVRTPSLRYLILFNACVVTMGTAIYLMTQPYLAELETPIALFGVVQLAVMAMGMVIQRWAIRIEKKYDDRWLLLAVIGVMLAGSGLSAWLPMTAGIGFLLMARTGWGFSNPIIAAITSRNVPGDMIATMLSIQHFAHRFTLSVFALLFLRTAADTYGVQGTLQRLFLIFVCAMPLLFGLLVYHWHSLAHRTVEPKIEEEVDTVLVESH